MTTPAPQLEYSQTPRWYRRRLARRVITVMIVGIVGICLLVWWDEISLPFRLSLWERRARSFQMPPSFVAYEESLQASELPKRHSESVRQTARWGSWNEFRPLVLRQLINLSHEWKLEHGSLLFLHERRAADGPPRLIIVTVWRYSAGDSMHTRLGWFVLHRTAFYAPASVLSEDPYGVGAARWMPVHLREAPWAAVRYYFGQPDPHDDSHFTIAYEGADEEGVIDGWLMPDDTIKLQVRDRSIAR